MSNAPAGSAIANGTYLGWCVDAPDSFIFESPQHIARVLCAKPSGLEHLLEHRRFGVEILCLLAIEPNVHAGPEAEGAGERSKLARNRLQQCRLAGAVRTDERNARPALRLPIADPDDGGGSIPDGEGLS